MKKTKIGNIYAQIAAVCLVLYCAFDISDVVSVLDYELQEGLDYTSSLIRSAIFWIGIIGLAVSVLLNNRKGSIVAASVLTLRSIYCVIDYFSLGDVLSLAAYASLLVIAILSLKEKPIVKKIWFIPAALMLLNEIIELLGCAVLDYVADWTTVLFTVVLCIGLAFAGMWFKSFDASAPSKNTASKILVLVGAVIVLLSVLLANYTYYDCGGSVYLESDTHIITYYYVSGFFAQTAFDHAYGYVLILGLVLLFIGCIMGFIGNTAAASPQGTAPSTKNSAAESGSAADRLMELKKLLDAGALTQEEFEEKKKGILGS